MRAERKRLVVLDTNVWPNAALSHNGRPAGVVGAVLLQGPVVFSEATFAELETRIWKPKFDRYINLEARKRILHDARAPALKPRRGQRCIYRTALAANASSLVTGDDDLLSVPPIEALKVVTPTQALLAWASI